MKQTKSSFKWRLCADEEGDTCSRLSSVFREFGYKVIRAGSYEEALGLAVLGEFLVCVVDAAFAHGAGLALCSDLRLYNHSTPVILYSDGVGEAEQEAGVTAGAMADVLKPNFNHLLQAVLHALPRDENVRRVVPRRRYGRGGEGPASGSEADIDERNVGRSHGPGTNSILVVATDPAVRTSAEAMRHPAAVSS